jgi:GTP-binding protein
MKFLDKAKIYLRSGKGGHGCVSFRREKYVEFGGPDGGDGGKGADIIFEVDKGLNTLIDFRYQQHYKAKTGQHGMGRNRTGAAGPDMIIKVPPGTQILDEDEDEILADLTEDGQRLTFLKGGRGGRGNAHFKSSVNQAPRRFEEGGEAEETTVWLRLKLLADVGVIGLPNAGKSTLLSVVSAAKPKIADYPFTTLHPNLGVVKVDTRTYVMADIPGLIEGAHTGQGLGTRFLGHVERTGVLVHLIDATQEDVGQAYDIIRQELTAYADFLADKPEIIVLNKADAVAPEDLTQKQEQLSQHTGQDVTVVSAATSQGISGLKADVLTLLDAENATKEDAEQGWSPVS